MQNFVNILADHKVCFEEFCGIMSGSQHLDGRSVYRGVFLLIEFRLRVKNSKLRLFFGSSRGELKLLRAVDLLDRFARGVWLYRRCRFYD